MAGKRGEVEGLINRDERVRPTRAEAVTERLLRPFELFAGQAVAGGVLLFFFTVLALAWANSPWSEAYKHLLHQPLGLFFGGFRLSYDLHYWINDGLMAVFFFVVGLEIKREILVGELAEPRKAMLPIAGAVGGMLVPALVYLYFNAGQETARGWGIPMATDIAFALGVLTLVGRGLPEALKVFLVALAIVDDLGAVLVIAIFYTSRLDLNALGLAAVFLVALALANRGGFRHALVYLVLGLGLWYCMLISGVHATLAGVLTALSVPARVKVEPGKLADVLRRGAARLDVQAAQGTLDPMDARRFAVIGFLRKALRDSKTPLQRFEHLLHPWVTFAIMPIFAFFNAGVALDARALGNSLTPVPLGIALGLVLGKQVGVFAAAWLTVRVGWASLPARVRWSQVYGVCWLAGIGFTMSLFINGLAFGGTSYENDAKLGIMVGSIVSGLGGWAVLAWARRQETASAAEGEEGDGEQD